MYWRDTRLESGQVGQDLATDARLANSEIEERRYKLRKVWMWMLVNAQPRREMYSNVRMIGPGHAGLMTSKCDGTLHGKI